MQRFQRLKSELGKNNFVKFKNLSSGFHFGILLSSVLLIAVFSYLVLNTYHRRFDLSEGKVYSLSPQTVQVLDGLKSEPIHVYAFFREDQPAKSLLGNLLKEYAYHHRNFHYEFYDPDRMPAKAKQYRIDAYDTIVIETKGKRGKTKQITEEAITNVLANLLRQKTKRIVFDAKHGGPAINEEKDKAGFGFLHQKLVDSDYEVKESLLLRDKISKGADLFVLGGPHVDLVPEELKIIRDYLEQGGSVLFLVDPVDLGEGKNLEQFLLEYGVQLGHDVVVDKLSKLFGADYLIPLITEYKPHAITRGFRLACFFSIARSVKKAFKVPSGFEVQEIAFTGAGSWGETDLKDLGEGKAEFDNKQDQAGPLPIVVAVTKTTGKGRLVVIGDSDFVTNGFLNLSGNKDFILNVIAWLAGDELAISIRPRSREATPLYLKETDQQFLFYGPVLGLPFSFLMTGTCVFFWRRRFH